MTGSQGACALLPPVVTSPMLRRSVHGWWVLLQAGVGRWVAGWVGGWVDGWVGEWVRWDREAALLAWHCLTQSCRNADLGRGRSRRGMLTDNLCGHGVLVLNDVGTDASVHGIHAQQQLQLHKSARSPPNALTTPNALSASL